MKKGLGEVPEIEFRLRNECVLMCQSFCKFLQGLDIMCALTIMLHWYSPSVLFHAHNPREKHTIIT